MGDSLSYHDNLLVITLWSHLNLRTHTPTVVRGGGGGRRPRRGFFFFKTAGLRGQFRF